MCCKSMQKDYPKKNSQRKTLLMTFPSRRNAVPWRKKGLFKLHLILLRFPKSEKRTLFLQVILHRLKWLLTVQLTTISHVGPFLPLTSHLRSFQLWITSLFEKPGDSPMWTLSTPPSFTGDFPFRQHVQFWIFVHNCYQEAFFLTPSPFIYVHWLSPDQSPSLPSCYFCLMTAPPPLEARAHQLCPHLFVFNTQPDLKYEHYGLIIDRPSNLYADLNIAAIEAKFITYP